MNSARKLSVGASSQPLDAGSSRAGSRNMLYPDSRVPRKSSESTRSVSGTTNRAEDLLAQLKVENQIKRGAENMLQVLDEQSGKDQVHKEVDARRQVVELQLDTVNDKIMMLKLQLQELGVSSE